MSHRMMTRALRSPGHETRVSHVVLAPSRACDRPRLAGPGMAGRRTEPRQRGAQLYARSCVLSLGVFDFVNPMRESSLLTPFLALRCFGNSSTRDSQSRDVLARCA